LEFIAVFVGILHGIHARTLFGSHVVEHGPPERAGQLELVVARPAQLLGVRAALESEAEVVLVQLDPLGLTEQLDPRDLLGDRIHKVVLHDGDGAAVLQVGLLAEYVGDCSHVLPGEGHWHLAHRGHHQRACDPFQGRHALVAHTHDVEVLFAILDDAAQFSHDGSVEASAQSSVGGDRDQQRLVGRVDFGLGLGVAEGSVVQ